MKNHTATLAVITATIFITGCGGGSSGGSSDEPITDNTIPVSTETTPAQDVPGLTLVNVENVEIADTPATNAQPTTTTSSGAIPDGVDQSVTFPAGSEFFDIDPLRSSVSGTVGEDDSHFYFITSESSFTSLRLTTIEGDADLYIYNAEGDEICTSTFSSSIDGCDLTGFAIPIIVEVYGYMDSIYEMMPR